MGARLTESALYGHLWATDELRAIFDERERLRSWLEILATLAEAQAELSIVPLEAAEAIRDGASVDALDLEYVAAETAATGHSTLGLIHGLRRILPPEAREWVYYGGTVQDLTDTWFALAMRRVSEIARRDLGAIEDAALELARRYRDTPMLGRTHGQAGSPITFGLKAATWADEARRHLDRLDEGIPRWSVGQLAGAVGNLAFFGDRGIELRRVFCRRLGLGDPGVSWTTTRDRPAEFTVVLSMIAGTLGRIGNEVVQLQRSEIGEVREAAGAASVGSITMPHKRNPEAAEHLVTLARLVRAEGGVMLEGMVAEHERDGRAWKAEWIALPEACLLTGAALSFGRRLLEDLEVDEEAMRRNLEASPFSTSERVLTALSPALGKHRAQARLQELLEGARRSGTTVEDALLADDEVRARLPEGLVPSLAHPDTGGAGAMVDEVLARAAAARASQPGRRM
ncbi:MAG TPA: adenylosuccinate lyase family protein [Actinomycetota bacterium]|nr:adenylosuccinate lyase family protein [Actinomycetota bacterium]